ncbi:MAG: hypothetical protein R3C61_19265 [Bacteroidia bacterium]
MNPEQETYTLIERYLSKKLSPGEMADFEARCKTDQAFANEVILHTLAREEIHAASMEKLKADLQSRFQESKKARIIDIRRTRIQWIVSAAAAIALFVLAIKYIPGMFAPAYSPDALYAMNFSIPELHDDSVRGPNKGGDTAGSVSNAIWAQAIQAVSQGKAGEAVELYTQLMQDSALMQRAPSALNYQMGIALMLSDRHEEAIPYFDQVKSFDQKPMADWYKALAYLKINRLDEARTLLQSLSADQEQPAERRNQAAEILRKIEKIRE